MKLILGAFAVLIVASAVSRQINGHGMDFLAYYKAGARVVAGSHPYLYEVDFAYKYGPASVLPFLFFQLFTYDVARWIYCAMHIFIALAIPLWNLKLFARTARVVPARSYSWGVVVAFAATFRFVDGEFHTSQVGLWIYAATLLGALLITSATTLRKLLGVATLGMVSMMKIHSSILWLALSRQWFRRRNLILFTAFVVVLLIPNPLWWLEWVRQMKETTQLLPMDREATNRQGFFGVAVVLLHLREYGLGPWLLSLPFAGYAAWRLPRFSLADLSSLQPRVEVTLFLTFMSWMLWGFMASPLPWQYTYSVYWGVIPIMWALASSAQRKIILVAAIVLAVTPKGILGAGPSFEFESRQGTFFMLLILWLVLVEITARLKSPVKCSKS